ncbi:MAG: RNA-directed DNA polymerase [Patescibacteria group bacterium]
MSEVLNYKKLYRAYLDCRKHKRRTVNALKFEWDLESKLSNLLAELQSGEYAPGRSTCFVVENPTVREVFAADFKDRIVHHLLINEIEKAGESVFIYDSFACRKGKGTHKAISRLKHFTRKITDNSTKECWYAQLDISGFFMSIDHDLLFSIYENLVTGQNKSMQWKRDVLWLAKVIVYHRPVDNYFKKGDRRLFALVPKQKSLFEALPQKGLPIGNYSSQFSGNLLLNGLDNFIKRSLKCEYYARYVDDLVVLSDDLPKLWYYIGRIQEYLETNLHMKLNQKKTKVKRLNEGLDFLGYFIKQDYSLVRRRVVTKLKSKLYSMNMANNRAPADQILSVVNSYYGHFRRAASYHLREEIYENHLGRLKEKFVLAEGCGYLEIKVQN